MELQIYFGRSSPKTRDCFRLRFPPEKTLQWHSLFFLPRVFSSFFPFFLFSFSTFALFHLVRLPPFSRKVGGSRSTKKKIPPWCASSTRLPNWNSRVRVFCNPFLFNPAHALLHASPTTYVPPTSEGSHHGPTRGVVQQEEQPYRSWNLPDITPDKREGPVAEERSHLRRFLDLQAYDPEYYFISAFCPVWIHTYGDIIGDNTVNTGQSGMRLATYCSSCYVLLSLVCTILKRVLLRGRK